MSQAIGFLALEVAILAAMAIADRLDVNLLGFTLMVLAVSAALFSAVCFANEKILVVVRRDGHELERRDQIVLAVAGAIVVLTICIEVQVIGYFFR